MLEGSDPVSVLGHVGLGGKSHFSVRVYGFPPIVAQ